MAHSITLPQAAAPAHAANVLHKHVGATAPSLRATTAVFDWIDAAEAARRNWARNMLLAVVAAMALAWLLSRVVG